MISEPNSPLESSKMATENLQLFQEVVDNLFNRWSSLKLAVEHMGGRNGLQVNSRLVIRRSIVTHWFVYHFQTAIEIKDYVFNYCTQNEGLHDSEVRDLLNDVIDEEFDTICEDDSVNGESIRRVVLGFH